MTKYLAALTLFGGLIVLQSSGHANQPPAPVPVAIIPIQAQPTVKTQRAHYTVRHIDATTLASVVGKHFKGEAEVLAVPTASGNTLLISGSQDSIGEVFRLLEQLDRKPRTVEVEIVIADITSKKGPDGKEVDLSGLEPLAKLEALTKAGAGAIQRIKLTAVEGQPITSTTGGSKPYVSGAVVAGGGGFGGDGGFGGGKGGGGGGGGPMMRRSITYHETGTTVKLTARIGAEDVVALDLNVQDSKIRAPDAGDEIGAAAFDNNTLNTKLNVSPGKAVAAQAVRTDGKTGGTMSLVIVTAHVVEPGAGKSK